MKYSFIYKLFFVGIILAGITSCKTSETARVATGLGLLSDMEYLEQVTVKAPALNTFSSKMKLNLNLDGKLVSVGGNLRMKRDEVIQISIVPLLGIEVARIEITPESVLVIDRMNKQYALIPYANLSFLKNTDINFNVLQSLFFNEIFLPGKDEIKVGDLPAFSVRHSGRDSFIWIRKTKALDYSFNTITDSGLLTETQISHSSLYRLDWNYSDFKAVGQKEFPSVMRLNLVGVGKQVEADFNLSRMSADDNWETRSNISNKYTQIDTDELLKRLFK